MTNKDLILIGCGGHSKVVADACASNERAIQGFLTSKDQKHSGYFPDALYLEEGVDDHRLGDMVFHIAIGDNARRKNIADARGDACQYTNIIHKTAIVATDVQMGKGVFIGAGAIINSNAKISDHVIINTRSVIEHDTSIESFVHIAPGCVLAGGCCIQEGSLIGIHSTLIPQIQIGRWCVIGAGSVVLENIQSNSTAVGSPCRIIKNHEKML